MNHVDQQAVNAIRVLSADAIQKSGSGHPGLPLGAAATAYELWANHMNHNPANPQWINRDRFILSGGHGSMLLYSLLHLFGYEGLSLEQLKRFRKGGSLTPGHPEYRHTIGVEATTGPLGAGMGMAVGMAMAEKHLAAVFNKEGYPVIDHYTYVLGGDGCMMEGISSESFSLAGTLGLDKLIVLYDSNAISIEGSTDIAFTEDVQKRMEALGFQTLLVEDGNDCSAIGAAIEAAKAEHNRPSFITIKTQIGYGCPEKQGKASAHGEPLGADNVDSMKEYLGWPSKEPFYVPEEVYRHYEKLAEKKDEQEAKWNRLFEEYAETFPEMMEVWEQYFGSSGNILGAEESEKSTADCQRNQLKKSLWNDEELWRQYEKPEATRVLSGMCIQYLKDRIPNLVGGSADLAPSTKTLMNGVGDFSKETPQGRNLHFGVRELAMAAIGNGLMLHGGLQAYVSTFFVFSDYVKPMARLSALMQLPLTYVFTHDSIGVGEDGPTHEPVEQLAMLRAMPNMNVFRPCDMVETAAAWYSAMTSLRTPTALVLTRQKLAPMAGSSKEALKGGYIMDDCEGTPEVILIASGSEVELAVKAKVALLEEDREWKIRVVSMPCMDLFEKQSEEYKEMVLPAQVQKRVVIEALSGFGWGRYVGTAGAYVTMDGFGASAPAGELFEQFGFTVKHVTDVVKKLK